MQNASALPEKPRRRNRQKKMQRLKGLIPRRRRSRKRKSPKVANQSLPSVRSKRRRNMQVLPNLVPALLNVAVRPKKLNLKMRNLRLQDRHLPPSPDQDRLLPPRRVKTPWRREMPSMPKPSPSTWTSMPTMFPSSLSMLMARLRPSRSIS